MGALNKKIADAIEHKEHSCNSTISGLVADNYKTSSENTKHKKELSKMTTANKKIENEVECFKNKINSAHKTIAAQNAKIESMKQSYNSLLRAEPKKTTTIHTKLKNLARHIESNLQSFMSLVDGSQRSLGREEALR